MEQKCGVAVTPPVSWGSEAWRSIRAPGSGTGCGPASGTSDRAVGSMLTSNSALRDRTVGEQSVHVHNIRPT